MDQALDQLLGKNNYVIWCVSLKRATDRRQTFTAWAEHIGMSFQFWDATDYLDLTPNDFIELCNVHINHKKVSGASACRISITKCMEHFLTQTDKAYVLIFEDDAGFGDPNMNTTSSSTELSNKTSFIQFLQECKLYTDENGRDSWHSIFFGYYDGDIDRKIQLSPKYPMLCRALGTSCTHAMLFHRSVLYPLLDILHKEEHKKLPVDEFTKQMMLQFQKTIMPSSTIVGQISNEKGYIDYDLDE